MEENVIIQKKNNYTLIIIIGIIVLALGGLGYYFISSKAQEETRSSRKDKKEDKEEEQIEDDDPGYIDEEDDTTVTINDEWGRKYYNYLIKKYENHNGRVEGYLLDVDNNKVPELFLYVYDEREYSKAYMVYIIGNDVVQTKGFEEGYLALLYDVNNKKYDTWYMVTYDDQGNDIYYDIGKDLNPTSSLDKTIIISNDNEKDTFNNNYIEVPFDLHEYTLGGKDFDEDAFIDVIKQYNKTEIPNDVMMDYVNEMMKDTNS